MKAFRNKKSTGFTLVEIMIVVLIIGILLAIAIPNFVQARESSRAKACVANLKQLDSAKQQYMMDKNQSSFASDTQTGSGTTLAFPGSGTYLVTQYIRSVPACPAGGLYTTGTDAAVPTCGLATTNATTYGKTGTYPHALP